MRYLCSRRLPPGGAGEGDCQDAGMRVTVLAGGVGAARFLSGLVHLRTTDLPELEVTVIGNTGDDVRMYGLQVCPDLDSIMYCLAGVSDPDRGWGRADETFATQTELNRYGAIPDWFTLGDRDFATHIWRSHLLDSGYPLSAVTLALTSRWDIPVRLLPMTDDRVETHVVMTTDE